MRLEIFALTSCETVKSASLATLLDCHFLAILWVRMLQRREKFCRGFNRKLVFVFLRLADTGESSGVKFYGNNLFEHPKPVSRVNKFIKSPLQQFGIKHLRNIKANIKLITLNHENDFKRATRVVARVFVTRGENLECKKHSVTCKLLKMIYSSNTISTYFLLVNNYAIVVSRWWWWCRDCRGNW